MLGGCSQYCQGNMRYWRWGLGFLSAKYVPSTSWTSHKTNSEQRNGRNSPFLDIPQVLKNISTRTGEERRDKIKLTTQYSSESVATIATTMTLTPAPLSSIYSDAENDLTQSLLGQRPTVPVSWGRSSQTTLCTPLFLKSCRLQEQPPS